MKKNYKEDWKEFINFFFLMIGLFNSVLVGMLAGYGFLIMQQEHYLMSSTNFLLQGIVVGSMVTLYIALLVIVGMKKDMR